MSGASGGADEEGTRPPLQSPKGGREPAAAGLLGWLADPKAPSMCVVSGPPRIGKSYLLAWLAREGIKQGVPAERAVHAVVPLARISLRGALWALASQLDIAARAPDELIGALHSDPRRSVFVFPGLEEAGLDRPESVRIAQQLLLPLLRVAHVRVVTEARAGSQVHHLLESVNPAIMNLADSRWTDQARYEAWRERRSGGNQLLGKTDDAPPSPGSVVDALSGGHERSELSLPSPSQLSEPDFLIAADPLIVTAAFEAETTQAGESAQAVTGLREAWVRAGQALCEARSPSSRALILRGALGSNELGGVRSALDRQASDEPWSIPWSVVRGDAEWPGPVAALAGGRDEHAERLLLANHTDVVQSMNPDTSRPIGRLRASECGRPISLASLPDRSVFLLDEWGAIHEASATSQRLSARRMESLFAPDADPWQPLRLSAARYPSRVDCRLTAMTATAHGLLFGDTVGRVHLLDETGTPTKVLPIHEGPVNALATANLDDLALVYSGGIDGSVRVWAPSADPLPTPFLQRNVPVSALTIGRVLHGIALVVAWGDGLVELHALESEQTLRYRPGPPVRAVHLHSSGRLFVGMDEAVTCLEPWAGISTGGKSIEQ